MARLLCLDVIKCKADEVDCNELQDFYDVIGCDCFDVSRLKIGEKYFDCFVDDEGLLKEKPIPAAVSIDKETGEKDILLVGNIVFANHDGEGNTTSLSNEDIDMIKRNLVVGIYGDPGTKMFPCLMVVASY